MSGVRTLVVLAGTLAAAACGSEQALGPATLDTRHDTCAHCRMSVSSARTAAQVAAPGEEPLFFDDLGCVTGWLEAGHVPPTAARIFVADHRTSEWVAAETAIFTRVPGLETPMGSGIVAHASAASRDADPAAAGGAPIETAAVLKSYRGGGS